MYVCIYIYIYIYMRVCVCMCVCVYACMSVWAAELGHMISHFITLTLTLTLILLHQPETTTTFGSIHRLCHSNYDLSTPTLIRSSDLAIKTPSKCVSAWCLHTSLYTMHTCVCTYVCMRVWILHRLTIYTVLGFCTCPRQTHVHTYIHTYIHACMHT